MRVQGRYRHVYNTLTDFFETALRVPVAGEEKKRNLVGRPNYCRYNGDVFPRGRFGGFRDRGVTVLWSAFIILEKKSGN